MKAGAPATRLGMIAEHDLTPWHRLQPGLLRLFSLALRTLPPVLRSALGSGLGALTYPVDAKDRRIAVNNVGMALGVRPREARRIARRAFMNFGRSVFENLAQPVYGEAAAARLFDIEGIERLERVPGSKRGVIVFSGHLGNPDLLALEQARRGYPADVIVRAAPNPLVDAVLCRWRQSTGNRVLHQRGALREVRATLREGGTVLFQIDQNMHTPPRLFVPFFGRLASVTPSLGLLAVRYRPIVIPAVSIPLPRGRYRISYREPLSLPENGAAEARAWGVTAAATAVVEGWIRDRPDSWLWLHDRWKDQPFFADELAALERLRDWGLLSV